MATASPSSASKPRPAVGEANRAQVSPTAALVAVATIAMALSLYATVFAGVVPDPDRNVAEPTLNRVQDTVISAAVAAPEKLSAAADAGPNNYRLHIALRTDSRHWSVGPTPPASDVTETATRRTAIRIRPGTVRSGHLRVVVWR